MYKILLVFWHMGELGILLSRFTDLYVGRSHHCAVGLCFPRPRRLLFRGAGRYGKGGTCPNQVLTQFHFNFSLTPMATTGIGLLLNLTRSYCIQVYIPPAASILFISVFLSCLTQNIFLYSSECQTMSPPIFLYLPAFLQLLLLVVDKYDRLSGTRQFCRALTYPVRAAAAAPPRQRRRIPQLRRVVTAIIIFGCHQGPITVFQHPFLHALRTIFIHHQASWHPPRPHSAHQLSAFVTCFNGTV